MKYQMLFPGKNKKNIFQFVLCWICPECGKGYFNLLEYNQILLD